MAFLVWDSPQGRLVHALDRSVVIVGSDDVADFRVRDPSVAKRHALIQVEDAQVKITDLGSDQGTKINGASLMPELPSTLEPGDFINLGKIVLTFHRTPPPAAVARQARPGGKAPRTPSTPREAKGSFPWKWVALGLGFLLVGCLGALIAISLNGGGADDPAKQSRADAEPGEPPITEKPDLGNQGTEPKTEPKPEEKKPKATDVIEQIPPDRYATLTACPDLLEIYGVGFIPAKVEVWNASRMTAVGADGKRYKFKRGDIHRVVDRVDLARRAQKRIERQPVEEIKACFELAQWCFKRHVRAPLKPFLKRIVADRPGDPVRKFLDTIEADEKGS